MLIAHKIPFEDMTPAKWQAALRVKAIKDESKTDHKNRLKGLAQQLFPHHHMTHAIADALLIVEYVYRLSKGIISEVASYSTVVIWGGYVQSYGNQAALLDT
jgi:hypothetical protein